MVHLMFLDDHQLQVKVISRSLTSSSTYNTVASGFLLVSVVSCQESRVLVNPVR